MQTTPYNCAELTTCNCHLLLTGAHLDAAGVGRLGEDGGAVLQAPAHDDVQHMLVVLLGNVIDDWMLTSWVCTADDSLGACPGGSKGAVGTNMNAVAAAVGDEFIIAPDWVHLHLFMTAELISCGDL